MVPNVPSKAAALTYDQYKTFLQKGGKAPSSTEDAKLTHVVVLGATTRDTTPDVTKAQTASMPSGVFRAQFSAPKEENFFGVARLDIPYLNSVGELFVVTIRRDCKSLTAAGLTRTFPPDYSSIEITKHPGASGNEGSADSTLRIATWHIVPLYPNRNTPILERNYEIMDSDGTSLTQRALGRIDFNIARLLISDQLSRAAEPQKLPLQQAIQDIGDSALRDSLPTGFTNFLFAALEK